MLFHSKKNLTIPTYITTDAGHLYSLFFFRITHEKSIETSIVPKVYKPLITKIQSYQL